MLAYILKFFPLDVWMFRKPRPFSGGIDLMAESLFLPPPNTIEGAIASMIYDKVGGKELSAGKILEKGNIKVPVYGWGHSDKFLFRVPEDLIFKKGSFRVYCEAYNNSEGIIVEELEDPSLERIKDVQSRIRKTMIEGELLKKYLSGNKGEVIEILKDKICEEEGKERISKGTFSFQDLFEVEMRTGIKVKEDKTTEEGMLYNAGLLRPKEGTFLWVLVLSEEEFTPPKYVNLGGKNRTARVEVEKKIEVSEEKGEIYGKQYLASFGEFNGKPCPEWADPSESFPSYFLYFSEIRREVKEGELEMEYKGGRFLMAPGAVFEPKEKEPPNISIRGIFKDLVLNYFGGHEPINCFLSLGGE